MKADDIIKVAREELKNFIAFEVKTLWNKLHPNTQEPSVFKIYNYDLSTTPTIGVWYWEDADSGYTLYHRFHHIEVNEKDEIFVYLENFDNDDVISQSFNEETLSTDELYAIASDIEVEFKNKM